MQRQAGGARRITVEQRYEPVVRAELPGLLRYATALCGDPELGRDMVQEVLVRAFERWDRIACADKPGAYLMRMVTNEFLSFRRRWSTRSVVLFDDDALERAGRPAVDHGERIVQRDDLERRLARLPRRQQAALVLRYLEGLDYADAARILGCAEGTVRAACSRGLAALRLEHHQTRLTIAKDAT
jgi:RNA polymerase sigma factor (sigma-70 family)